MIEFFIDTSTSLSTIALLKDKKLINQKHIYSNNDLSNNLFKYIVELFDEVSIKPTQISRIYAATGPGSFTGIRIGLTVAKIYAYALNIKIVPISSLQILASSVKDDMIISLIDARRGYVFAGGYDDSLNTFFKDTYINLNELKEKYPNAKYVSIDNFDFEVIKPNIDIEKVIALNNSCEINAHDIKPNYLKITEAEVNLKNA